MTPVGTLKLVAKSVVIPDHRKTEMSKTLQKHIGQAQSLGVISGFYVITSDIGQDGVILLRPN